MNAGELEYTIKIYKPTVISDASGQKDVTYDLYSEQWAKRKDLATTRDTERGMNQIQTVAGGTTQFTIRYDTNVKADMVIESEGTFFDIAGEVMVSDMRRHWTILNTERRDNIKINAV